MQHCGMADGSETFTNHTWHQSAPECRHESPCICAAHLARLIRQSEIEQDLQAALARLHLIASSTEHTEYRYTITMIFDFPNDSR